MTIDLSGQNVLISGGSRGIGLATSIAFAEAHANVAILYESDSQSAERAVKKLRELGVEAMSFQGSVADESLWQRATEKIVQEWKSLDVVVANAGIWKEALIDSMTMEEFETMMRINMTGTFLAAKHAAIHMKKQRSGSIVIVSSTAGQRGESEHSHYAASKGAQISFTKSLAPELAPWNIRVNAIAPGWVKTDMTQDALANEKVAASLKKQIPLGRAGEPYEIANAILFLASPLASFITGEVLNVNGGAVLCG